MARAKKSDRTDELEVFERYLVDNRLKHSRQRRIILELFLETEGHPSVDDLYRIVQKRHPEIGRTTIYRTLKLLCDANLAQAIELEEGVTRFEHRYKHEHHDHLVCTECGVIVEYICEKIEKLQDEIAEAHGFAVHSHRHQIFGICPECQRKLSQTRRNPRPARSRRLETRASGAHVSATLSS
jgi:Fur family ferric uptake transcriptional regulator